MSSTTFFAPAERASAADVLRQSAAVRGSRLLAEVLAAVPDLLVVLNPQRQIVFANRAVQAFLEDREGAEGMRPGELLGCINVKDGPGGCGTSVACGTCGLVGAILAVVREAEVEQEARLSLESGDSLDLRVRTHSIEVDGERLTVVSLRDIADEKRRQTLERLFFHDVLNTAGGVQGLAGMLRDADDDQWPMLTDLLETSAGQLVEEIRSHRVLVAAEDGDYRVNAQPHLACGFVREAVARYAPLAEEGGVAVNVGALPQPHLVETDAVLLGRVLGNLVKNAVEASRPGMQVTVSASVQDQAVVYEVHNPSVMPRDIQLQVFQRSFSTKGSGRGLGTYSVRLFTEKYLGGSISFRSAEGEGTTFRVTLPLR